jgi:hypothetical protein
MELSRRIRGHSRSEFARQKILAEFGSEKSEEAWVWAERMGAGSVRPSGEAKRVLAQERQGEAHENVSFAEWMEEALRRLRKYGGFVG